MAYVYCIRDEYHSVVKIGFSKNPFKRLFQIRTGNPSRLVCVGWIKGSVSLEKWIHEQWCDRRVAGEWFDDGDGLISRVFSQLMKEFPPYE